MQLIYKNKLLECTSTLFHLTADFRNNLATSWLDNFRERISIAFSQFEQIAFAEQIPQANVQQAKYALAAFIDEIVLSSTWSGRNTWMSKPLQLDFFGEHLAGENFFKRLNDLRQNALQFVDVLEIYYACLQLGFEGMYRLRGIEQILGLQVDLAQQIYMIRGVVNPQLSAYGIPKWSVVNQISRNVPFWVIISVTTAIVFFIYLGFVIAIDHQANHILSRIKVSETQLMQEVGYKEE